MASIETLGDLIDDGYRVSVHCHAPLCWHWAPLDLVVLAERFGRDFVAVGNPNPLAAKLRCSKCQSKKVGIILLPVTGYTNGPPAADLPYGGPPSDRPQVKTRRSRRRVRL